MEMVETGPPESPETPDDFVSVDWLSAPATAAARPLGLRSLWGVGPASSPPPPSDVCVLFMLVLAAVLRGLERGLDDTCSVEQKATYIN